MNLTGKKKYLCLLCEEMHRGMTNTSTRPEDTHVGLFHFQIKKLTVTELSSYIEVIKVFSYPCNNEP